MAGNPIEGESNVQGTAAVRGPNTAGGDGVVETGVRGVVGQSDTFQGVLGKSRDNSGIVGESTSSTPCSASATA